MGPGAGGDGVGELWEGCAADPGVVSDEGLARGVGPEVWMGLKSQTEAAAKGEEFVLIAVKFWNAYVKQSNRWAGLYLCCCCCSCCHSAATAPTPLLLLRLHPLPLLLPLPLLPPCCCLLLVRCCRRYWYC